MTAASRHIALQTSTCDSTQWQSVEMVTTRKTLSVIGVEKGCFKANPKHLGHRHLNIL